MLLCSIEHGTVPSAFDLGLRLRVRLQQRSHHLDGSATLQSSLQRQRAPKLRARQQAGERAQANTRGLGACGRGWGTSSFSLAASG